MIELLQKFYKREMEQQNITKGVVVQKAGKPCKKGKCIISSG